MVEADIAAQARALLCTIARHIPHRTLIDGHTVSETAAWLLAGSAGVPEVLLATGQMFDDDWQRVIEGLERLRDRELLVSSTGAPAALRAVAEAGEADVVLVHDAARFGHPTQVLPALSAVACDLDLALVVSSVPIGELPERVLPGVTRVGMHGFDLGGRASLVRPDPDDLLSVEQLDVDCLSGKVD